MSEEEANKEDQFGFMLAPVDGDEFVGMVADNGEATFKAIVATGLVRGATSMQKTSPVASAALGRAMICTLLLSQGKKEGEMYGEKGRETIQLDFRGDGPLTQVFALGDSAGEVRGYVAQPKVHLPLNEVGKLDVAKAVGKGFITVVRNNPFWQQPYTGITSIVSGEIAEDIAHYLTESEQTPSALGAGVLVSADSEIVTAAGGWLVQMLPGASEETIAQVEKNIMALNASPTQLISSGKTAHEICAALSAGLRDEEKIETYSMRPRFTCKCNIDKVYRTIALLPRAEMEETLAQEGEIEVKCEFCKRTYSLKGPELAEAYESSSTDDA